jgi:hypothetical protein
MEVRLLGRVIDVRAGHFQNARMSIVMTPSGRVIDGRELWEKAKVPIEVRLLGRETETREPHAESQPSPKVVNPSGRANDDRWVREKA